MIHGKVLHVAIHPRLLIQMTYIRYLGSLGPLALSNVSEAPSAAFCVRPRRKKYAYKATPTPPQQQYGF